LGFNGFIIDTFLITLTLKVQHQRNCGHDLKILNDLEKVVNL